MFSEKALSKVSKMRKGQSNRKNSSFSYIPAEQQAHERQQYLKSFHRRKLYFKKNMLEKVCQQNYRIYYSINQQRSSYRNLFHDKHSSFKSKSKQNLLKRSFKVKEYKQNIFNVKSQLSQVSRLQEIIKSRAEQIPLGSKKIGVRQILTERVVKNQFDDNFNNKLSNFGEQFQ